MVVSTSMAVTSTPFHVFFFFFGGPCCLSMYAWVGLSLPIVKRGCFDAMPLLQVAPRFEIKKWNAVAMWSWDICADTCAICRNSLNEPSIEYQVIQQYTSIL